MARDSLLHLLGTRIKATRLVERMVPDVCAALSDRWRSFTDNQTHWNSGLMMGNTVALRYSSLRRWGTCKEEDRSHLFPPHGWTLFRCLGAVLHKGGEIASLSLLIQSLTYVLFTRLIIILILLFLTY